MPNFALQNNNGRGQKFNIINKQKANHLAAQQRRQQLQQRNENRFVILGEKRI